MSRRVYATDRDRVRAWRKRNPGYGLTAGDVIAMLAAQDGGCAICGHKPDSTSDRRLAIDHDHETGRVRGLLCYRCNTAIGLLGDDPERLRRAADYLA